MENLLHIEFIIILLLFIVSIVAIAMRLIKLPYTVALVLVGLTLAFLGRLEINLTREIILLIFIPPLVFEAAFHIHFDDLRENLALITILAVPGVLVVTFITGGIMAWAGGLSIGTALVFGALIAATDPVAVVAIFKELGAPKKLATIVEGESLFNDGTAIVIFNIILGIAISGDFNALNGVFDFTLVSGGGIVIGLGLGWVCARIITAIDDRLVETTLTTVLAYGAYLAAEEAHVSGVLAVVAAGILNGNISPQKMSATSKVVVFSFWEYVAFLANSLIFLLIGLEIDLNLLRGKWGLILLAWGSLMLARAIAVYGLGWLENRLRKNKIPRRWQHLLTWGGLKGAISLALALGLPGT
ncbi:MAG: cation:proton antiporter [Anaerolineae bacterium]